MLTRNMRQYKVDYREVQILGILEHCRYKRSDPPKHDTKQAICQIVTLVTTITTLDINQSVVN